MALVEAEIAQRGNLFGEKPASDELSGGMGEDTPDLRKRNALG
jgi:hypothetical protein